MTLGRRRFLAATAGTLGAGALAGCTGGDRAAADDGITAAASFFVFGDVSAAVAGDAAAVDLVVPTGQHGHGWEPGPRVREAIGDADLLVHGMTGFQPWLDSIVTDLEADGSAVRALDVSESVDLLEAGEHDDHSDGDSEPTGTDEHHTEATDHDDEHDHENVDPHFWMDPLRVKTAAETVREALTAVDDAGGETYEANAAAFGRRLAGLDEEIQAVADAASNEVLLVAGHDSFGYLADRYGLTIEALTNVSPDDRPTARDIERAQQVVADHDLRYVCADPLESQQAAEALVAETDAEAVLPLTAMPGLTDEWAEQDWGYLDMMTEVNLPTLERALGA